jgi:hypothetical protein
MLPGEIDGNWLCVLVIVIEGDTALHEILVMSMMADLIGPQVGHEPFHHSRPEQAASSIPIT